MIESPARRTVVGAAVGTVGAAVVIALADDASTLWAASRWWVIAGSLALGALVGATMPATRRLLATPGAVTATALAGAVAVYGCVPEVSNQMPVVFVLIGVTLVAEVVLRRSAPLAWHGLLAAVVLWAGLYGATGRERAFIGTWFALWPMVIVPVVAVIQPRLARTTEPLRWLVAGIGAVAAVTVARTGALEAGVAPALVSVAVWGPLSLVLAVAVAAGAPPAPEQPAAAATGSGTPLT
jgi:hypothetical protein